jgi:hypothetical protein
MDNAELRQKIQEEQAELNRIGRYLEFPGLQELDNLQQKVEQLARKAQARLTQQQPQKPAKLGHYVASNEPVVKPWPNRPARLSPPTKAQPGQRLNRYEKGESGYEQEQRELEQEWRRERQARFSRQDHLNRA